MPRLKKKRTFKSQALLAVCPFACLSSACLNLRTKKLQKVKFGTQVPHDICNRSWHFEVKKRSKVKVTRPETRHEMHQTDKRLYLIRTLLTFKRLGFNRSRFRTWSRDAAFILSKDSVFVLLLLLHGVVGKFKTLQQQGSNVHLLVTKMMRLTVKMKLIITMTTLLLILFAPWNRYDVLMTKLTIRWDRSNCNCEHYTRPQGVI